VTTSSASPPLAEAESDASAETKLASAPEGELLEHEYDGIREYDNPLPGWWVAIFWGSFVFSIVYGVWYHVSPQGTSVAAAYDEEMSLAREERAKQSLAEAPSDAVLGKLMADADMMQDAKLLFAQRCAVCHAAEGQGLIGPNLTDDHWIHGDGSPIAVYEVVSDGVPAKGMPAWELQLKPIEVRKLAAFVATLHGKNLPGKAPEGNVIGKR
jgi:cytochrome c oxidase cbb3-type subunit 3